MQHLAVTLKDCEYFHLTSDKAAYKYEIRVSVPKQAAPEEGFPVYYVLDGHSYFQHARDIIRLQSKNAPKTHIAAGIVVGIGHAEKDMRERRFYDFTAPADEYIYPDRLKGHTIGPHGGAQNFIECIEQELKPYIEMNYCIDPTKQTLFGHSLGGYFALWVLFTKPELFQVYLASSPSIWWNNYELLSYVEHKNIAHQNQRLLLTVGEQEAFMVDDAKSLSQILLRRQLPCEIYIAPDENHASVVPTIMSRAFRFAQ